MKNLLFIVVLMFGYCIGNTQIGKVGINTNNPLAMLHVKDSSVLFSGASVIPASQRNPPVSGGGVRMMWYPDKAAFRTGYVAGLNWNKDSIGDFSFASGSNSKAKGIGSFAAGVDCQSLGESSFAVGEDAKASGRAAIAIGNAITAVSTYDIAIGSNSTASGGYSIALGYSTSAEGPNSFASGFNSLASGYLSSAIGNNTWARGIGNTAVGSNNDPILTDDNESIFSPYPNSPMFMVGNGTNSNRKNALIVQRDGKVGIGDIVPLATLHLKGLAPTFDAHLRLETYGGTDYMNMVYDGNTKFRNFGVGDEYQFRNSVNTTIMRLFENGDLSISGSLSQNSDTRLKKLISQLKNSLQKIIAIGGYQYYWKENSFRDKKLQAGILAQEVEQQMPELVSEDEEGLKSVNYSGMIPYLIEAVKELKKENDSLRKEIELIKRKN
ncbi:MAG: tail fiber domain-containing protein [Chitinophagaceae bacterium]